MYNRSLTSISYKSIPKVHQSTALVCPHPLITSGAIYSTKIEKDEVKSSVNHIYNT